MAGASCLIHSRQRVRTYTVELKLVCTIPDLNSAQACAFTLALQPRSIPKYDFIVAACLALTDSIELLLDS